MSMPNKMPKVGAGQAKPKKLWATCRRLLGYMKGSSLLLGLSLLIAIAGTVMQVLTPKMLGNATTFLFAGAASGSGIDLSGLSAILMVIGALYAGVFVATFLQERIMVVISQKITCALRGELKQKMNRVPVSWFDSHSNGDLMSVAVNDMDNIATTLQQNLTRLISSVILFVGILWIMLTISPLLTLLACLVLPGGTLVIRLITPRAQKNNKAYWQLQGTLSGQIEETYQGFPVVKSFGGEEAALQQFRQTNEQMYEAGWKAKFFGGSMMPCMLLIQNGVYVLVAVAGAVKVIGGAILIGDMQAFLQYSTQFSEPITQFSQIWNNILSTVASAERVFDVLDAGEMGPDKQVIPPTAENAKVVFDHVRFGYTQDQVLMRDFSLQVSEGETVAIVGHTGAGKSTLIHLLQRFYEIQDGSIRLDGWDIRSMTRQEVRKKIGMVLQDTWLFHGTIYDNIRYGNRDATPEQVRAAAQAAWAEEFILKLPHGYDTVLDEDAGNLSQGQRQLLTIARAFVADPDILILDEATSNVDSRTELVIQRAMKRLMAGRTSFVVAHRLSTIYDADRIVVMQDGDVAETGTHTQLLTQRGAYADIYNSQFARQSA